MKLPTGQDAAGPENVDTAPPIAVLGAMSVRVGGEPLELGPPRQRAVLALLLINAGRVVPVPTIVGRVWGAAPPDCVKATLQSYVSRLRKLLVGHVFADGSRVELRYQAPGYLLAVSHERVDARVFERAVERGRVLVRDGHHGEAIKALTTALRMWKGTPYEDLDGYGFAVQEAGRLEELRLSAVEAWADAGMALGLAPDLLHTLERETKQHPLRESLVGQLMRVQYRVGRQADALQVYERTRTSLAERLGADVSKELQRLHQAILRHDPALDGARPALDGPDPGQGGRAVVARRPDRSCGELGRPCRERVRPAAFVGRDLELRRLTTAAAGAFRGSGRTALVTGEAGLGKTRLVQELAHVLADEGVDLLRANCPSIADTPDYWPWIQLLRQVHARWPEVALELPARTRRALSPLLPELWPDRGPEPEPAGPGGVHQLAGRARFDLQDAACQVLLRAAARRPLVLVLEDLHCADAASLALLRLLTSQLPTVPLLLVATCRMFQLVDDPELRRTRATVLESTDGQEIRLTPLDPTGTRALATATLTDQPEPGLLRALHRRAGGNPYFLAHLLDQLEHGAPWTELATGVPADLREVVLQRVAGLPAGIVAVLEACAVIGSGPRAAVEAVVRRDGVPGEAVRTAVRGGLLHESPDGRLRFAQPLVEDTIRHELTAARCAELRGRFGQAAAGRPGRAEESGALAHGHAA
ncbi:BTAD domain-containing putative transcriptional regulator [Kitasatospora sp. NPDC052896]|uniref:BTAD domain-containing putative transcriptional regulator n=1 Tax=Kitasatospora sp. NPDC052896 TaxID=3364061 RepID=UPI0037CBA02D